MNSPNRLQKTTPQTRGFFATAHKVEVNPNFWALSNGLSIEDGSVQKKFTPQLYEQLRFFVDGESQLLAFRL